MTERVVLIIKIVSFLAIIGIVPVRGSPFFKKFLASKDNNKRISYGKIRWLDDSKSYVVEISVKTSMIAIGIIFAFGDTMNFSDLPLSCQETTPRWQTSERRKTLSHNLNVDDYIQPFFTNLAPGKQDNHAKFYRALETFLAQSPEFASSQKHMEFLRYCFTHYVNFDPEFRDLSILEKLAHAGKMAKDFLGVISGSV